MKKEKELKVEAKLATPNILIIDGQRYIFEKETHKKIDGVEHGDKIVFKKFNEEEYINNLKIIVNALAEHTNKKELITHLLKHLEMKTIRRLAKRIKAKKEVKKQHGCLGFKVGDAYVQLVD